MMCGGTAGDAHSALTKKYWRPLYKETVTDPMETGGLQGIYESMSGGIGETARIIKESKLLTNPMVGWTDAEDEHKRQKQRDDDAAGAGATPEDTSDVDSYAMANTGLGVGDAKKRTRKHGMRQNILTSGQGLN